jgi:rhamnulokinase
VKEEAMPKYVAVDLGAESGRVIVVTLDADAGHLALDEVYRFPNGAVRVGDSLQWDALRLWSEVKTGLHKAAVAHRGQIVSVAVDTWGIDYALLDRRGSLLGNPYAYRDSRTAHAMEPAIERAGRWEIYQQSGGVQFMSINTLYQLYAAAQQGDPALQAADTLLMMPDLFGYWLTGEKACEFTDATTTQFYNGSRRQWARGLLDGLGIPSQFLPKVIQPGTQLGVLREDVAEETELGPLPVIAVAGHDTASAVVAVPAKHAQFAWLSSGTWSLLGGVADAPIVTQQALAYNFSSYGGADGQFLPWKNIMGLWLVQECRRAWAREGLNLDYDDLTNRAAAAQPFRSLIDPDDALFLAPRHMPQAVASFCERTGQAVPVSPDEVVRTVLDSLALRYRRTLANLAELQGRTFDVLYAIGGGTRNCLLCQLTADATGVPLTAGPVEATAIGNAALQAVALGELGSLRQARDLIRRCAEVTTYEPTPSSRWDGVYARFSKLLEAGRM